MSERTYLDGYFEGRRDAEEAVTPTAGSEPGGKAHVRMTVTNSEYDLTGGATPPSSVAERGGLRENPDAKALIDGWHLTNGAIDAMNAALSKSFAIYDDPEAGTDVDGDSVTVMDRLMDNGYVVASWTAIRAALAATPVAATPDDNDRDEPGDLRRVMEAERAARRASEGGE